MLVTNRCDGRLSNSSWLDQIQRAVRRLKSCKSLAECRWLRSQIAETELGRNRFIANSFVEMFGKLGSLEDAWEVFESIPQTNVFSCNILIAAFTQNGHLLQARELFDHAMAEQDVVSWTGMMTAYAEKGDLEEARSLFDRMPERNCVSWNIMIAAYAQLGFLDESERLFELMPERDVVSWTLILVGFAEQGYIAEARWIFDRMPVRDVVSWTAMLHAYAQVGGLSLLLDFFASMPDRNVVTWNAMLQGCAHNLSAGLRLLAMMNLEGFKPDQKTFIAVLHGCSHWGLVEESLQQYASMAADHGDDVVPTSQHHSCIIDILGRAGELDEAESFLKDLPVARPLHWNTLATAARIHGDVEVGIRGAKRLMEMNPGRVNPATYVTLTDLIKVANQPQP